MRKLCCRLNADHFNHSGSSNPIREARLSPSAISLLTKIQGLYFTLHLRIDLAASCLTFRASKTRLEGVQSAINQPGF